MDTAQVLIRQFGRSILTGSALIVNSFNPFSPGNPLKGHRPTVQVQIRCHIIWYLITPTWFANRIFHQKIEKNAKVDLAPQNEKWTGPTYNSGRVHQYIRLKVLGTHSCFSTIVSKGGKFCDTMFTSFFQKGSTPKGKNLTPNKQGGKNANGRAISPHIVPINF